MSEFKIKYISIKGFWGEYVCRSEFNNDINIIIGKNGTGKTTFMNILHAVLSLDFDELRDNEFNEVTLSLVNNEGEKEIKVIKNEDDFRFNITYVIDGKEYDVNLPMGDVPPYARRRYFDRYEQLKDNINKYIKLFSLSVYRNRKNYEYERERERGNLYRKGMLSPTDFYLNELLIELGKYQLELTQNSKKISEDLQRDVLLSLLYTNEERTTKLRNNNSLDKEKEKEKLQNAYRKFGFYGDEVSKKIDKHIEIVFKEINKIEKIKKEYEFKVDFNNFEFPSPILEAKKVTDRIIELSSNAEKENEAIFNNNNKFINIIKSFTNKNFEFKKGELVFLLSSGEEVSLFKLSSGEKQLLILLIEALLQRESNCIFLADEPEISLHIEWQREIISSVLSLNPNAQIIVATHSPEIAGKYKSKIKKMSEIKESYYGG
ncbi:MAG: ATP-binding protein [Haemophilus parainfluenzae]|jgi:putative enzyme with ATPase activity|nr:ATP-binding protein [Haemophilus parainfluenzae]